MIQHNNGNIDKSINYFMQAAIYDIPDAQLQLALFYQNEKKDMKNAIFYYIKAAFNNEKSAQYIIGIYSIYGLYVNKNYDVGITFLTRSAQNKYQKAYFALGFLYQEGKCVKHDINESIKYYMDGSNVYDAYSQNNLGIIYKHGFEKQINKDISRSNHFFQKGYKDKKNALCMINLAKNYIYYDENIDTSIKLLIHASNKCRSYKHKTKNNLKCISISRKLLSFALIRKYGNDIAYVMKQFKLNYDYVSDELVNDLHYNIVIEQLDNKFIFKEKYESYRDVDFVYNLNKRIISLNELMDSETEKNKLLNLKKDIDEHFYKGFGC